VVVVHQEKNVSLVISEFFFEKAYAHDWWKINSIKKLDIE